jgi:hypothetical protein
MKPKISIVTLGVEDLMLQASQKMMLSFVMHKR